MSGVGTPVVPDSVSDVNQLWSDCKWSNERLWWQLHERPTDEAAADLMKATEADAGLGRVAWPKRVQEFNLSETLLHPRFGVAQLRADGSTKVRPISLGAPSTRAGE